MRATRFVLLLWMFGGSARAEGVDVRKAAEQAKAELGAKLDAAERARLDRGVDQIAALWRPSDGDLVLFAREHFLPRGRELDATFDRFEHMLEQIEGHELEIGRALREPTDLDVGPLLPVDPLFAAVGPFAHNVDDFFDSKLAFVALLNFPLTTLKERLANGASYSRRQWAEARLTARFALRIPAEVATEKTRANADADLYVATYNVWMHHLVGEHGDRPWRKGLRLISHWNLRDELKANYADKAGGAKQRTIQKVMERIVTQTIPAAVIDNPRLDWNPFTNAVTVAPAGEVEEGAPARPAAANATPEADVRYAKLLALYRAARAADPYSPTVPTAIARSFERGREIPEERVVAMLTEILASPLVAKVAKRIEARLGRKLEPFDIWYNGFQPRSKFNEADLDALTRKRYPTPEAFAADIPRILRELGFPDERARYVAERIAVDPARGSGHALQALLRGDKAHLRTRVEKDGMSYKGYNTAIHELGHNVEQTFSLYDVDHTLLAGVPNNAFTEALAFVFQARDVELLGLVKPAQTDAEAERARVLNAFWQAWEIAGVGLVDIQVWHWMYEHPSATPAELKEATLGIARAVWNKYYAPVLGTKDSPLLAIYSHMITSPLYLCDYPIGHLIAFQIEEHLRKKGGPVGPEFERMAKLGSVAPDVWMSNATGEPVGTGALLRAVAAVLAESR